MRMAEADLPATTPRSSAALAGESYHRQITSTPDPVRVRARFQEQVVAMLAPGATVLDFGAGTGIDTRFLAERGHRLQAFEPDAAMVGYLRFHCADLITASSVSVVDDMASVDPVDMIIADFAVLNLVDDLPATLRRFHAALKPDGRVIASVLNPWAARDMQYGWWWRNVPSLIGRGTYEVGGASGAVRRVSASYLARTASPWFRTACLTPAGPARFSHPYLFVRLDRRA